VSEISERIILWVKSSFKLNIKINVSLFILIYVSNSYRIHVSSSLADLKFYSRLHKETLKDSDDGVCCREL
jgi:hypothetical protein